MTATSVRARRDALLGVITRAWQRDPDPSIDPVWFAGSSIRLRRRPPSSGGGDDCLRRLRAWYGPDPSVGLHPDSTAAQACAWIKARHGRSPDYESVFAPVGRFVNDLYSRCGDERPDWAALWVAADELEKAHELYLYCLSAARYRRPLLMHRIGDEPAAATLIRATGWAVDHLYWARLATSLVDWRDRVPVDGSPARVGGEHGVSLPDTVFRLTDRVFTHAEAVARSVLFDRPGRVDRLRTLFPTWLRRTSPTAAHLLYRWASGGASLLHVLPNADQAKAAAAEIERRKRGFTKVTLNGVRDWAGQVFGRSGGADRSPTGGDLRPEDGAGEARPAEASPSGWKSGKAKGKQIDARMLKVMAEDRESHGWTARQWADHLHCSPGTVKETKTWRERLKAARAVAAADAAARMDRSNTRPSGRRARKPT